MVQKKRKSNKGKTERAPEDSTDLAGEEASAPNSNSDAKPLPQLPLEILLDILDFSAYLSGTKHARNVCLVSKAAHKKCWPALHRIVTLQTPVKLDKFSRSFYPTDYDEIQMELKRSALRHLFINNNKASGNLPVLGNSRGLILILAQAKNLQTLHFEEYWSVTNESV
jgi:hypothetical protein